MSHKWNSLTVANQTIEFGGLTRASAGGAKAIASDNNEVDFVSVTNQGGATRTWSVSSGRLIANGTPGVDNGIVLTCTTAYGPVQITIKSSGTDANGRNLAISCSVRTELEVEQLYTIGPIGFDAVGGPYNALLRAGNYGPITFYNAPLVTRVTIAPHVVQVTGNDAVCIVEHISYLLTPNVTFDGLKIHRTTTPPNSNLLQVDSSGIIVENCEFYGPTLDPDDPDWADLGGIPSTAWNGITTYGAPGIIIRNNTFHDLATCIGANPTGALTIQGNYMYRIFGDMIHVLYDAGATTLELSDNVGVGILAGRTDNGGPPNNPHADFMQIRGTITSDWTVNIWRNRYFNVYSRSSLNATINVAPEAGPAYIISSIKGNFVCGNAYSVNGLGAGRCKNSFLIGNTLVKNESVSTSSLAHETPALSLELLSGSSGTQVVKNNVGGVLIDNGTPYLGANNVVARSGTETMSDYYVGPTFGSPDKDINNAITNFMTRFAMKPNGLLDVDNSGTASVGDVGAVGSGYVTWATTIPGNDGSFNLAYEAPVLTSPTGTSTGTTTANVGVTTDEPNGTWYWVVTTSSTKPTSAQIRSGQNHLGAAAPASGSAAVSSVGTKAGSATGLTTATTYYAHFIHRDSDSYDSNIVSSASFTTS